MRLQLKHFRDEFRAQGAVDTIKKEFEAAAKVGNLTPLESIIGRYVMYEGEYGGYLLMCLILRTPPETRLLLHNWSIAGAMSDGKKEAFGAAIASLEVPLFPDVEPFVALNQRILTQGSSVSGGGTDTLFASREDIFGKTKTSVSGGGYAPLGQLPDGSWAADTSAVEAGLRRQIAALERRVTSLGGTVRQPQNARGANQHPRTNTGGRQLARGGDSEVTPTKAQEATAPAPPQWLNYTPWTPPQPRLATAPPAPPPPPSTATAPPTSAIKAPAAKPANFRIVQ